MELIQGKYYEILDKNHLYDGIVTDIPFKGDIKRKLHEEQFLGKKYRKVIELLFNIEKYIVLIDPRGIGEYKKIITNLLKIPAIKVWDKISRIKYQLEKKIRNISLNKISRSKIFQEK